jgi:hypothetical protein
MPAALRSVSQLALDEQVIEDDKILTALESYQNAKAEASAAAGIARREKEAAVKLLDDLNIDVGMAVRIGAFRVAREARPARHAEFDVPESEVIRISFIAED